MQRLAIRVLLHKKSFLELITEKSELDFMTRIRKLKLIDILAVF